MSNVITVSPKLASQLIEECIEAGLVPLLKGSPGTSKSVINMRIAKKRNLYPIDVRLGNIDEVDLSGYPDLSGEYATYKQFDTFPTEKTPIPEGYAGWYLFFDELTSADKDKQGAAYKIILDRLVGQEKLHSKVVVACAGNLVSDKAVAYNMSTALQSRLVHINMGIDKNDWIEWAMGAGIDNRVISFIEYQPSFLHKFDPNHQEDTFACQRTWEFASRLLAPYKNKSVPSDRLALFAGTVSQGVARELLGFCQLSEGLVKFADIVKDPANAKVPTDPGQLYATVGMLADHFNEKDAEPAMVYISRMPEEFKLATMKRVYHTNKKILAVPVVREWLLANAKEWVKY